MPESQLHGEYSIMFAGHRITLTPALCRAIAAYWNAGIRMGGFAGIVLDRMLASDSMRKEFNLG